MSSNWNEIKLGEIADFRNGINYTKESFGKGVKVIGVKDFQDYSIPLYNEIEEINPEGVIKENDLLQQGDILFVRSNGNRELIGRSLFINKIDEPISHSAFTIRVRFTSPKAIPKYYAFLFRSRLIRDILSAYGGGTNISNLNQQILNGLVVPVPPLLVQRKIADVLSAYDDLIEVNARRIHVLEAMTQSVYHEWFGKVDVNSLPRGWQIKELQDTDVSIIDGDRGKNYPAKSEFSKEGYCLFLNAGNFKDDRFDYSDNDFITEEKDNLLRQGHLQPNDTVLTTRGTVGKIAFFSENAAYKNMRINSGMVIIRPKNNSLYWYYLLKSALLKEQYKSFASGSAQPQLPIKDMNKINVLIPAENVISQFCEIVEPFATQIEILLQKSANLRRTRDLLLPRLVSGEIEIEKLGIQ